MLDDQDYVRVKVPPGPKWNIGTKIELGEETLKMVKSIDFHLDASSMPTLKVTLFMPEVDVAIPVDKTVVAIPLAGLPDLEIPLASLLRWSKSGVPA